MAPPSLLPTRRPTTTRPGRIAALDSLPLFFTLTGRRAIVIGGDDAAVWKAELLLAAGAHVTVLAERVDRVLAALLQDASDRLHHRACTWTAADLTGATLVVASLSSETEAELLRISARQAGCLLNVIDWPAFCDFSFGTIVNRSPVVIGIGTGGAAPILGQRIRQRMESLLPPILARWAELARSVRDRLAAQTPDRQTRRRFWEQLSDQALRGDPVPCADDALSNNDASSAAAGQVTLVGAGPGDAGLLTLSALRAMQAADVILYDDLVSPEVLELARREAHRMLVGKRGGGPSCHQDEITDLMLRLARSGRQVVRLKSGDPMIFGRAGEEIEALEAAGIPVTVVPGVTAALAAAARFRIPVTHRDLARRLSFITGHAKDGALPSYDWAALTAPETTTFVYMPHRTLCGLAGGLIDHGMPPDTPAALMFNISRADERLVVSPLAALAETPADKARDETVLFAFGPALQRMASRSDGDAQASAAPDAALSDLRTHVTTDAF